MRTKVSISVEEAFRADSGPEYKKAVEVFYRKHVCMVWPFPKDFQDTFEISPTLT
jgi:hypothetical protein